MDFTTSQYSGGGDSGWTMYLEQSYVSRTQNDVGYGFYGRAEEEDLSMVSDASSGPRCNFYEHDGDCCHQENNDGFWFSGSSSCESTKKKTTKKKEKSKIQKKTERYGGNCNQMYSCLDDTASSAMQSFASEKEYLAYEDNVSAGDTLGFSETKSKGKSGLRKHLRFFQSSVSEKSASEGKGNGTQRRNRG